MSEVHAILRTIRRYDLVPPGSRVLVALSGGSDSVALTCLLIDAARDGGFEVAGLAHLNHGLRPTAGRDEAFCRRLAADLAVPIQVETVDVAGYAASQRLGREEAARRLRYDFLIRAAAQVDASRIAVGHTQDDQAETFLLKLIRGAGAAGLGGIYPRRGQVIRPLLDLSRDELRHYLQSRGAVWLDDETNEDVTNPRNRLRHVVLPELERTYGGAVRPSLARAADLIREDGAMLDELADQLFAQVAYRNEDHLTLDRASLAVAPAPIVRRVLLRALRHVAGGREVGLVHVRAAEEVLTGASGGTDAPGGRLELRGGKLVLKKQKAFPR